MQHGVCAAVIVCSCARAQSVQLAIEQIGLSAVDTANWC
jgi:hypothetical protein